MKVRDMGEFGLIELIAKAAGKTGDERLLIGIGDDAACWRADGLQMATTDALIENVHFNLKHMTWRELGWKAMAVNLSDIAAMGGQPLYALMTLGIPPETDADNVIDLYKGMLELARKHDVRIVGGDTVASPLAVINLTIIGEAKYQDKILKRSAARPGDLVAVTGTFGASAAGLAMMQKRLSFDKKTGEALREAHFKPVPRIEEGQKLVRYGVKAAIDVSDGLLGDLEKMCAASGVGAILHSDRIPIHPTVVKSSGNKALSLALTGGEDYELIFAAPAAILDSAAKKLPCQTTIVGEITKNRGVMVLDEESNEFSFASSGWDHFTKGQRA